MTFVLLGGVFMFTILLLVKIFPENPIVPTIFIMGWIVFALFLIKFLRDYNWRN